VSDLRHEADPKGLEVIRQIVITLSSGLLAGCASVNPRPAFVDVDKTVSDRTGQRSQWIRTVGEAEEVQSAVRALLKDELTAQKAAHVALLSNRNLQAAYEEIGISQADLAQAALVSNPEFDGFLGFPNRPDAGVLQDFGLVQDFLSVLVRPLRKKIGAAQLEQTKLRVGDQMLRMAAETKAAFYTLQARQQLVGRLELILDINRTAAEFAQRQHDAGNIGDLDLVNQQAVYNQTKLDVAMARAQVRQDRERLNRLMGLWGMDTGWTLADRLPEIPEQVVALEHLESLAIGQRLDVEAARWGVDLVGRALALKKGTRYFPVGINIGVRTEREPEKAPSVRTTGPTLALQLPIFDTGRASIARLEAQYQQSQRLLEALAVDARSEVREARDLVVAWKDMAGYYRSVLLPQRVQILDLTLRHYNMMLKGAYDLLLAKQAEVATERAYVEAWRDYWIARTELERAVGGRLPLAPEGQTGTGAPAPPAKTSEGASGAPKQE